VLAGSAAAGLEFVSHPAEELIWVLEYSRVSRRHLDFLDPLSRFRHDADIIGSDAPFGRR
jgi:hypothetical protein